MHIPREPASPFGVCTTDTPTHGNDGLKGCTWHSLDGEQNPGDSKTDSGTLTQRTAAQLFSGTLERALGTNRKQSPRKK